MFRARAVLAVVLCILTVVPSFGQTGGFVTERSGWFNRLIRPFETKPVAPISFEDSARIERLIHAGTIYLSLRDAIALALENNLDIEVARYDPKLALSDLQRASAGQLLRNVSSSLSSGPSSASLGVLAMATAASSAD